MRTTIHEAIELLEEVRDLDDSMYQYNSSYMEALDMAIEALKFQELGISCYTEVIK